jgi:hypothetical protein
LPRRRRETAVPKGRRRAVLRVSGIDPLAEYLVYAEGGQDRLIVKNCGRTRPLSKASAVLAVLGDGQSSRDEPLPDTLGGEAGLGVLGLAAVATTTAAYLLLKRLLKS